MSDEGEAVSVFAAIVAILLFLWVLVSHFEAAAFNAATGKNVTTWQAMWISLRVQEQAKEEK